MSMDESQGTAPILRDGAARLPAARIAKIGLFHLGSGIADVLTTGVWNRIMISDLGFNATPIALLLSLRYFLIPFGIWSGELSDKKKIFGTRRLFWIWSGRAMMLMGIALMGWRTADLVQTLSRTGSVAMSVAEWLLLALAFLLFSMGSALSGSTFLALLYDRAPQEQRGQVVGVVWTFLLIGFLVAGILFGILLPESTGEILELTPAVLRSLFTITVLILAALWFFSLLGEERRKPIERTSANTALRKGQLRKNLSFIWGQPNFRAFLSFLVFSMFFAFLQDIVLEPFAGDVFAFSPEVTARFSAYWGGTAIVSSLLTLVATRRWPQISHSALAGLGVGLLTLACALFALAAFAKEGSVLVPGLLVMGCGLGVWNIGTVGLMMDFSPTGRAGTFMGIWTVLVTFARGGGVLTGGLLRDVALALDAPMSGAYGAVFFVEAIGLFGALLLLQSVKERAWLVEQLAENPVPGEVSLAEGLDLT